MPATKKPRSLYSTLRGRPYSKRWRATYGQTLSVEEIRLLQGFRGLPRPKQFAVRVIIAEALKLHSGGAR